jgi:hypothetical protein
MQEKLADLLQQEKERLTKVWCDAVRSDARIQSAKCLSNSELHDHAPAMIEELGEILRAEQTPDVTTGRDARVHVYTRLQQGYRARDVISELSHFRITLLDYLTGVMTDELLTDWPTYTNASRIINLYFDEEIRYAVSIYTEAVEKQAPEVLSVS